MVGGTFSWVVILDYLSIERTEHDFSLLLTKGVTRYFKFLLLDFPPGKDLNLELGDIHKAFLQKVAFFFSGVFITEQK